MIFYMFVFGYRGRVVEDCRLATCVRQGRGHPSKLDHGLGLGFLLVLRGVLQGHAWGLRRVLEGHVLGPLGLCAWVLQGHLQGLHDAGIRHRQVALQHVQVLLGYQFLELINLEPVVGRLARGVEPHLDPAVFLIENGCADGSNGFDHVQGLVQDGCEIHRRSRGAARVTAYCQLTGLHS